MPKYQVIAEVAIFLDARDEDAALEYALDTLEGKTDGTGVEYVEAGEATVSNIDE